MAPLGINSNEHSFFEAVLRTLDEKRPGSYTGPLDDSVVEKPTSSLAGSQGSSGRRLSLLPFSPGVERSRGAAPHQGKRSESTTHERERCGQGQPGAATTVREPLYRGAPCGARRGACRGVV